MIITWDIESNNLLNQETIDYNSSPYKLKPTFVMHCIVVEDHSDGRLYAFYDGDKYILDGRAYQEKDTQLGYTYTLKDYTPLEYTHLPLANFPDWIKSKPLVKVVGHNIINFDLLATKLYYGMSYDIGPDHWQNKYLEIVDTMVLSKTLNPDRFGGHSLDKLSEKAGLRKIDFRPYIKNKEHKFKTFAADMLYYCIRDVQSNTKVLQMLEQEKGTWPWDDAINLEKKVQEIVTRQEHRGFKFDKQLAEANLAELDKLIQDRREKVEPLLPKKKATKSFMKDYTPPKKQFLGSGEPNSYLRKFAEKVEAEIIGEVGEYKFIWQGKPYDLPLNDEPLVTEQVASIDDTTHIKEWLVGDFGWMPSEYKEKDLSVRTVKGMGKVKRTPEELQKAIQTYVEQTLSSPFCHDRCEFLDTTPEKLERKLMSYKEGRSIKVLSNPNFTVGQEKEMCPNLELLTEKFPYARDVVEYLTYKHRRNSILGGGLDWDDEEEAEKGYLAYVREDGRIPTPADTCGAATSRFKHRVVANIPRVTSLFGENMRAQFGVDCDFIQIGYDFDSLEARGESHYCWRYDEDKEYCNSLVLEKPNDVHSTMARKISEIIKRQFNRSPAKSVKYAATYGATAGKIAKTIGETIEVGAIVFDAFWQAAAPLKQLKDNLQKYWEQVGGKKFILGIDKRKVPTRSAHAILNSLFQSAGVICAKRAAVIHDRKLKEVGLSVDFFTDDWKSKLFCQQLCMYHDEAQLEVHKSLVKWRVSKDKEEIAKIKTEVETETGLKWSDIGHVGEKYYIGYCKAGELAVESVLEASRYYNLNVDLTAGYMLGRNWAECH